jgi:hypothetical protein
VRLRIPLLIFVVTVFSFSVGAQQPQPEITLNIRPFIDLGHLINDQIDQQLDLGSPFTLEVSGIVVNGRIDPKSFKIKKLDTADPKMRTVLIEVIRAVDASGYLNYISMMGGRDINLNARQDGETLTALLELAFDNEYRPQTIASMFSRVISSKKDAGTSETGQAEKDQFFISKNTGIAANGKNLSVTFKAPKADVQELLKRKLAEQKVPDIK